jgi:hypothetical protein
VINHGWPSLPSPSTGRGAGGEGRIVLPSPTPWGGTGGGEPLAMLRIIATIRRWQSFTASRLGARLTPLYATLLGGALGALIADRLVRSMWSHAIFTGTNQWRTVALLLVVIWIAIGAVAALAILGPPAVDQTEDAPAAGEDTTPEPFGSIPHSSTT